MEGNIFLQISTLLAITVSVSFIARLLKQPLIIAYIIAGIICGPAFFNLVHGGAEMYEAFAQFGVVLLLFIIGLNLNFRHLKTIGKTSFITGIGQVLFTGSFGTLILYLLGLNLKTAVYLAVAITFSSTIIIMKLLADKKDTETIYGKYTIGLMLVQDVIAVVIMIVLGVIKSDSVSLGNSLLILFIKGLLAIALVVFLSYYILPRFLDKVSKTSELLFIFTIAWCFGLASLLYWLGFSLEIGAIVAGISLSSSPYQLEIGSRIKPLRDFFLVLFFIVLGSEMTVGSIGLAWLPALVLSLFILIGNPLILYILFRRSKFTRRNSFLAGLTAAQVSEFGFVILFIGQQVGHIHGIEIAVFTLVAITTIFISSYLIMYNEQIYRFFLPFFRLFGKDKHRQLDRIKSSFDVWVVGYHRIGKHVCEMLKKKKTKFAVIDFDPDSLAKARKNKMKTFFGDIADVEFLEEIPIASSKLIIMTIPAADDQVNLIKFVRSVNKKILIIANAYHYLDMVYLYESGADYVIMPHYMGGHWISDTLKNSKWTKKNLDKLKLGQEDTLRLYGLN